MKIIAISGLDGSGKSTQIELLRNYLESQNKRVFYFHANQFSISKTYNILRPHKVITGQHKESVAKANFFQIQLRKIALIIDLWRFKKLIKKLEHDGYDYILSDRYFYDSIINIEYLSGNGGSTSLLEVEPLKADLAIYLDANPEIIMSRERVPDQGMEYLKTKKSLYEAKIIPWNMRVIDGNRDKNIIFEEIKQLIS